MTNLEQTLTDLEQVITELEHNQTLWDSISMDQINTIIKIPSNKILSPKAITLIHDLIIEIDACEEFPDDK